MKEVSGTMYAYSFLCTRKLWYFANNIAMEEEHENVAIGKWLDENTYRREDKHFLVDDKVNIDYLKKNVVYEVKKSDSHLEMAENQVKYYLYILREKGMNICEGVINVPPKKITKKVLLCASDIIDIQRRLESINDVIMRESSPEIKRISACSQCAYFELCFI